MSDGAHAALQRALQITARMLDAAASDDWSQVINLDAERQPLIRQASSDGGPNISDRDLLQALHEHNHVLLERATTACETVERRLSQHKYNHRALRTYITSSR